MLETLWHAFQAQLAANQFLSGGLLLGAVGALLASLRGVPRELWRRLSTQVFTYVEIRGDDPAYEWLTTWLACHPYTSRSRILQASAREVSSHRAGGRLVGSFDKSSDQRLVVFTPAPGSHFLRFRGRLVWVWLYRAEVNSGYALWRESATLRVLGRDAGIARALLEEAREAVLPRGDGRVSLYAAAGGGSWRLVDRIRPRSLDSVILDGDALERLRDDMERFLGRAEWYDERGIPYRRGYLLFGIPGSGKTSAVKALAGALGLDLYLLSLAGREMSDDRLLELLADVPPRALVVLEDVDAAFAGRTSALTAGHGPTFSGLLNALDGAATKDGRLLVMTTNHAEKLDPALVRPGRVDVREEFGHATREQIARMFRRFFPDASELEARLFARSLAGEEKSMAEVQEMLLARERAGATDGPRAVAAGGEVHG